MLFGNIVSSPRDVLSPTQALELANAYLEKASKANDPYIALILYHDTEISLSQAPSALKFKASMKTLHPPMPVLVDCWTTVVVAVSKKADKLR